MLRPWLTANQNILAFASNTLPISSYTDDYMAIHIVAKHITEQSTTYGRIYRFSLVHWVFLGSVGYRLELKFPNKLLS